MLPHRPKPKQFAKLTRASFPDASAAEIVAIPRSDTETICSNVLNVLRDEKDAEKARVVIRGYGPGVTSVVIAVESVKGLFPGLHQIAETGSIKMVDEYEMNTGETASFEYEMSWILITLSAAALDKGHIGYQKPQEPLSEEALAALTAGKLTGKSGSKRRPRKSAEKRTSMRKKEAEENADVKAEGEAEGAEKEKEQPKRERAKRAPKKAPKEEAPKEEAGESDVKGEADAEAPKKARAQHRRYRRKPAADGEKAEKAEKAETAEKAIESHVDPNGAIPVKPKRTRGKMDSKKNKVEGAEKETPTKE